MNESHTFTDVSDAKPRKQEFWPTLIVPRAAIDAEIERLASIARPASGRRAAAISHPYNKGPVPAFAPGIDVTLEVLRPGEESAPIARNSTMVDMCIRGAGAAKIGTKSFAVEQFDVWNTPSMDPYVYRNDGRDLFVRLSYSNAPLLERLEVHYVDTNPQQVEVEGTPSGEPRGRARDAAESIDLGAEGARLLGYEYLVDIDTVRVEAAPVALEDVNPHLGQGLQPRQALHRTAPVPAVQPGDRAAHGTSPCFFATIAKYPPDKTDQPHRHVSAAINYYFIGHGKSTVLGQRLEWEAGDLHLSAPGWAVHHHGSREQGFCALTIQDHPLHIAMDSLLWQETMKAPILKLGSQSGFQTNLTELETV
jgi:gentisate 1,2-dioxygenase